MIKMIYRVFGLGLFLITSCVTSFHINAIVEPAQVDESMIVAFVTMDIPSSVMGIREAGLVRNMYRFPHPLTFIKVSPDLIGPLPTDTVHTTINGRIGGIAILANIPGTGVFKISSLGVFQSRGNVVYVFDDPQPSINVPELFSVEIDQPGIYYMGAFSVQLINDRVILIPIPGISKELVYTELIEDLDNFPTWRARLLANLKGVQ